MKDNHGATEMNWEVRAPQQSTGSRAGLVAVDPSGFVLRDITVMRTRGIKVIYR